MAAALLNLELDKGSTWYHTLVLNQGQTKIPLDLTGYTAKMQVRANASSQVVLFELSTANGRIIITPETGTVKMSVDALTTGAMPFNSGVYDMEITSADGEVTRIIQGTITASAQVTR